MLITLGLVRGFRVGIYGSPIRRVRVWVKNRGRTKPQTVVLAPPLLRVAEVPGHTWWSTAAARRSGRRRAVRQARMGGTLPGGRGKEGTTQTPNTTSLGQAYLYIPWGGCCN